MCVLKYKSRSSNRIEASSLVSTSTSATLIVVKLRKVMSVSPMYAEEAPFDTIDIGNRRDHNQNYYSTNFATRTDTKPSATNRLKSRDILKGSRRHCCGTTNSCPGVFCTKRRFTDFLSLSEMSPQIVPNSTLQIMDFCLEKEKSRLTTPTTGGTTTIVTDRSVCTSSPSIQIKSPQAYGTVMSLYDFAAPELAFQALFGTKNHEYYCPLLDEEIDQEMLISMYKQVVTIISNQMY